MNDVQYNCGRDGVIHSFVVYNYLITGAYLPGHADTIFILTRTELNAVHLQTFFRGDNYWNLLSTEFHKVSKLSPPTHQLMKFSLWLICCHLKLPAARFARTTTLNKPGSYHLLSRQRIQIKIPL